ncbi:O-methyltransferase [Paenibacillus sp. GCM10012307]|uniref:O-methyltransferase n=1 Tax=Paenibacillus roseus TaxID=2798579 RepID=A0A934IY40_9BACL|nr:O-methyltransferase [Paenibacillus roseus]MBJ6359819.1 O-methyltransferase [Paenibacillus roseus]
MEAAEKYVADLFREDEHLERAKEGIREAGMPEISIQPAFGRMLTMLAYTSGAQNILEIGALGGYSGICLARGLREGGSLTSLELEAAYADVARRHLTAAGLGDKVIYRIGDAAKSLGELESEGRSFDFFFIDADKQGYPVYLDHALRLARPGALIVADNTLLRGRVTDPDKQGPSVHAMRSFNERLATDERLISTLIPAYDGLSIAVVK